MSLTHVLFRTDAHGVVAVFPREVGTTDPGTMTTYEIVGQHGSGEIGWYRNTRRATPAQYADLKAELEGIGYKLLVRQRISPTDHAARKEMR